MNYLLTICGSKQMYTSSQLSPTCYRAVLTTLAESLLGFSTG